MKLDYTIDMEDPENARAVEEVFKDSTNILEMQGYILGHLACPCAILINHRS